MGFLDSIFRGKEEVRPPEELKRRIKERDNYTCQQCGRTANEVAELHIHHIKPLSKGGTNDPSNLVTLCDYCHSKQPSRGHNRIRVKTPPPKGAREPIKGYVGLAIIIIGVIVVGVKFGWGGIIGLGVAILIFFIGSN